MSIKKFQKNIIWIIQVLKNMKNNKNKIRKIRNHKNKINKKKFQLNYNSMIVIYKK